MKHLLLLTPGFAADENDSRCIPPLQLFARKLQERGVFKISIIGLHYPHSCERSDWHGIPVYSCHKKGRLGKFRGWREAWRWIKKIQSDDPVDGIHSFWLSDAALLGHWFCRYLRIPHWVTMMGQDVRPSNRYLRLLPLKKLRVVALSDFHKRQFQQTTGRPADHLIPWGIDPERFPAPAASREIDVVGAGNLIALKNYALFIDLLKRLQGSFPRLKAVLIGDGPEWRALEERAERAGLSEVLEFTGYLPRPEVLRYLSRARIFLHTSSFESFGYVFPEALACGAAVVSTPVGMAASSDSCLCGDTEGQLFDHLSRLLTNPPEVRRLVPHPISETVDRYLELYNNSW